MENNLWLVCAWGDSDLTLLKGDSHVPDHPTEFGGHIAVVALYSKQAFRSCQDVQAPTTATTTTDVAATTRRWLDGSLLW